MCVHVMCMYDHIDMVLIVNRENVTVSTGGLSYV